jgi:hypothetical protein
MDRTEGEPMPADRRRSFWKPGADRSGEASCLAPGIPAPLHSDWSHRPALWAAAVPSSDQTGLASSTPVAADTRLFHDCPLCQITLAQSPTNSRPLAITLAVAEFQGSYLSLAIDLPAAAARGLLKRHLIRVGAMIEAAQPTAVYARLNILNGPNTERLTDRMEGEGADRVAEFDLAYSEMDEARVDRLWLDLIFEAPRQNRITVHDLTLSRRPRAQL